MKITYSQRFEKSYKKLNDQEKAQVRSKLKMLAENPSHPSLRCKRIQGTRELFECSVNMDIRIICHFYILARSKKYIVQIYNQLLKLFDLNNSYLHQQFRIYQYSPSWLIIYPQLKASTSCQ